jgi:phospho-N-acetylmuramoyl-pentapeptide-transferase
MNLILASSLLGFFITFLLAILLIPLIKKLNFGQIIREWGPASHKKKAGTPAFGGIIFISAITITILFIYKNQNNEAKIALYSLLLFGIVGLIDDSLKKLKNNNEGISPNQKMILLFIVSGIFAFYAYYNQAIGTSIYIPIQHKLFKMGFYYVPFIMFFYIGTANAVNLTDGLDGLCTTVTILVMTFLLIASIMLGHFSLGLFCGVTIGCLLAFLKFNAFQAQIIMGDTGSIALGGAIATIAMILKLPLIVPVIGVIYFIETLSVIIQVTSFKLTGKRVFKMTPIHHTFELLGWHEAKIVATFSIITTIFCIFGYLSIF